METTVYLWGIEGLRRDSPALDVELHDGNPVVLAVVGTVERIETMMASSCVVTQSFGLKCSWHSGFVEEVCGREFFTLNDACKTVLRRERKPTINAYANLAINRAGNVALQKTRHEQSCTIDDLCREPPPRHVNLRKRQRERLVQVHDEFGELTAEQAGRVRERVMIEHTQELACAAYIGKGASIQRRVHLRHAHVVPDVIDSSTTASLDLSRECVGMPWEVKDCDGIHPFQHAHGQADFQRVFANAQKSCLWLFTCDDATARGRRNFELFCDAILPSCQDRYEKVILARRLRSMNLSRSDALDAIICVWSGGEPPAIFETPLHPFSEDEFDDEVLMRRAIRKGFADEWLAG